MQIVDHEDIFTGYVCIENVDESSAFLKNIRFFLFLQSC